MRIRTTKPEFWRSDDIDALCLADRLLFVGLWNYVDDEGRGVDKASAITADLFAGDLERDPSETSLRVHGGLKRLHAAGLIDRYEVSGRRFLAVVNFHKHQRINRPTPSRLPSPTCGKLLPPDDPTNSHAQLSEDSPLGTEEQGNRGGTTSSTAAASDHEATSTHSADEAQSKTPQRAPEPPRDDVEAICTRLRDLITANLIAANGPDAKTPTVTQEWRRQARLMLDIDKRELSKVLNLIEWCQADTFWQSNVMSVPKFRQQYDQLALRARQEWSQGKAGRNGTRTPLRERLKGGAA